jgi:pimeloyl-ACP methyl ester carboxylesterase
MSNQPTVRPFSVDVPEEDLVELRRRVQATRWSEKETVADQTQGVQYYNQVDRGGHFAAWEQPQLFTGEIRAAFRSLR